MLIRVLLFFMLFLIPISALVVTIRAYRHDKILLLKKLGASFLISILAILMLIFFSKGIFPLFESFIEPQKLGFLLEGVFVLAFLVSTILLFKFAQKNNKSLYWIILLTLANVVVFFLVL